MDNLISLFFPTAPSGSSSATATSGSKSSAPPKQFSPEFFELLQGDISALTAPGHGTITTSDIDKLSDTQVEILGNFLSNVEVSEDGEMIYSNLDVESFATSMIDTFSSAEIKAEATARPENDPAVVDLLSKIPAPAPSVVSASASDVELLKTAFEKLSTHIEQLLGGLPKESRSTPVLLTPSESASLETNSRASVNANAELIATGLSPETMMSFLTNIGASVKTNGELKANAEADALKQTERHNEDADLMFSLIAPAQVQAKPMNDEQNVIFLPRGIVISATASSKSEGKASIGSDHEHKGINIAADANAGSKAGENVARALNKALQSLVTQGSATNLYGSTSAAAVDAAESEGGFDKILGMFEQPASDKSSGGVRLPEGMDRSLNAPLTHAEAKALADVKVSAGLSTVPSNTAPSSENVSASTLWNNVFPDGINWSTSPNSPQTVNNSLTLGTMTSLSSQSNAATAAHPSTQMVAATITKAGQGENKNITLRLDPPQLGKVHVRLEMSEDNIVKAIVTSEKPQTHMMMQRDAHVLEKALQDAGLDANGSNLEFTLSQDGSLFGDNKGRGGENDSGSGSSNAHADASAEDGEIIESQMTWNVDPESGYMHYNLVV